MGAHQPAGGAVGHQFADTGGVFHGPSIGHVTEVLNLHHHINAMLASLGLGDPDTGDLRFGEHRRRHEVTMRRDEVIGMGEVVAHGSGFVVGHVFEQMIRADVTQRPDPGHRRPLHVVDDDAPIGMDINPCVLDVEGVGVGNASGGDEQRVSRHGDSVVQGHRDGVAVLGDVAYLRVEMDIEIGPGLYQCREA